MQKQIDKIIKEISLKYRIPVKDVEDVVKSQFALVREVIESATKDQEDTFKTIQLPLFGKFLVKKNRIKYIIKSKRDGSKSKEDIIK